MGYKPKNATIDKEELDSKFHEKMINMLSSIKGIGSMYVEPGDIVVTYVKNDAPDEVVWKLQDMLSKVFKDNKGIVISDDFEFKLYKKEEQENENNKRKIKDLEGEIKNLKKRLEKLEK